MKNTNLSSPPESPNSFMNRKIHEINALLESLNLTSPPLERDSSCLEGDVGFFELFKEYKIGSISKEEIDEEEEVVEVEDLGIVKFINGVDEVSYKMPHKIKQFQYCLILRKNTNNRSTLGMRRIRKEK
ncbi:hypothetical protein Tco_0206711 [Tanacetum coccineum]